MDAVRGEVSAMNAVKADAEARAAQKKKELQKAEDDFTKAKRLCVSVFALPVPAVQGNGSIHI